ncbi:ATP-dependent helicase ULS1 [Podospora conica]|nr:ATP-dependent helicase ULS1 [Schizothecium conicum]
MAADQAGVTPTSAHRKRSISSSHLDPAVGRPESKSRKPSPIAWGKASSNNDPFDTSDLEVVDLTGDDDTEWKSRLKKQRDEENRLALKKQTEARDAKMARELAKQSYGSSSSAGTSSQGQSRVGAADAFERMRNQRRGYVLPAPGAGQHPLNSVGLPIMSSQRASFGYANVKDEPSSLPYSMPGSYPTGPDTVNPRSLGIPGSHPSQPGAPNRAPAVVHGPGNYSRNPFAQAYDTPVYGNPNQLQQPVHYMAPQHPSSQGLHAYQPYPVTPQPGAVNRPGSLVNGLDPLRLQPASSLSSIYRAGGLQADGLMDYSAMTSDIATYVQDLLADPRKTEEEIGELLSNIRPDMEIPAEERGTTPEALRYPLYPHQILALGWMIKMEEGSNKGGILADDMGLGKTISTLALMVSRKSEDPTRKTNLIIGPVALVKQWQSEIEKKLKSAPHNLRVYLLHQKKMTWPQLKMYDVVLTTYGSIAAEWKRYDKHVAERKKSPGYDAAQDEQLHKLCPILHPRSGFYRVILDEAQYIKNISTLSSTAAAHINATHRWCLTGTPMMNGANELAPLIRFLHIRPYNDKKAFDKAFECLYPSKSTSRRYNETKRQQALSKLQVLLKAIMLRRTKTSVIDGKPILTLPPKTEIQDHVVFSPDEGDFYKELETKSVVKFRKFMRAGTVGKSYSQVLTLLLRLRQACCHPHLLDFEVVGTTELSEEKMIALAQGLEASVVERVKAIEDFECPICYDAVEDPTIIIPCGHDTCSECFVSLSENAAQDSIMAGNDDNNRNSAKCPVCRGEARSDSVVNYKTFQKVHMPDKVPQDSKLLGAPSLDDDSDSGSEYESDDDDYASDDDADDRGNLRDFVVDDDVVDSDDDDETDDDLDIKGAKDENTEVKDAESEEAKVKDGQDEDSKDNKDELLAKPATKDEKEKKKKRKKQVDKARRGKKKVEKVQAHQLGDLRKAAVRSKKARSKYMHYLRDNWEDSAKVTRVLELLSEIQLTGEKTIIFSQWTALLDLIECRIKSKLGLGYCRYTGSMSRTERDNSVQDFINTDKFPVMLVSLRAGNAGLNLVAASNVIICDPFWNPYIEMQAIDRAHRIGQQRPVKVYRILIKDTIEDRILELQQKKRDIIDAAMDETQARTLGRLSTQDLLYLFGGA